MALPTRRLVTLSVAIATLIAVSPAVTLGQFSSLALTYDDGQGNTLPYRLFLPPGHDTPGAEFPLVMHLHGAGERGTNNTSQLLFIDGLIEATQTEHPAYLLVPQAPPGFRWNDFDSDELTLPARLAVEVIGEIEQQYSVDTSRRYVTGLSLGGFGSWDLIGKLPDFFEAAFPLSGYGDPARAQDYLDTRVWTFHGGGDTVVPVVPKRETVAAIRDAGGDPLYTEVLGGHGIWRPIYDDPLGELYDWVFDGVLPELVDFQYDPTTGDVLIDASQAPGGSVNFFSYAVNQLNTLEVPDTVFLDGVPVASTDLFTFNPISLDYNDLAGDGFTGVLRIPGLLPTDLDFLSLSGLTSRQFHFSPATGDNRRFFNLSVTVIPEPSTVLLLAFTCGLAGCRLRG